MESRFDLWMKEREVLGETLVEKTFSSVAQKWNSHFVINPTTKASFAQFLRTDTQSKRMGVAFRTAKAGAMRGFIPIEPHSCPQGSFLKPLYCEIDGALFWISESGLTDIAEMASFALVDEGGKFVTSDIDVISIGIENDSSHLMSDALWGELTESELKVLKEVNRCFQERVGSSFELCAHGPASRFSRSKRSHLHFPLQFFCPNGSIQWINNFEELLATRMPINPLWL